MKSERWFNIAMALGAIACFGLVGGLALIAFGYAVSKEDK